MQYAAKTLMKSGITYKSDDDAYDTIAPVTQDIGHQDEGEGCTDTHPDLNETFDNLSSNLGIPSTQQDNEPLVLNEIPDDIEIYYRCSTKSKESFSITLYI